MIWDQWLVPFQKQTRSLQLASAMELYPATLSTTTAPANNAHEGATAVAAGAPTVNVGVWSTEEHERYLQAKFANPKASWKEIARLVGTRSARQVILHDQKFRAKMERRRTKKERTKAINTLYPNKNTVTDEGLRYFDSMGVMLLASVASSSRMSKADANDTAQATVETLERPVERTNV